MITYGEALKRVGERTIDNRRNIARRMKQRRTGFGDMYGSEVMRYVNGRQDYYISVSPDLEYWERFQLKIEIQDLEGSADNFKISIDGVDLTPYFKEQHGDWVDGEGVFPSDSIDDDTPEADDFYDILDACGLMYAGGLSEQADKILSPGMKRLRISGVTAEVGIIIYIKHSFLNR